MIVDFKLGMWIETLFDKMAAKQPPIGTTTLVDLKAELFKKREEAKRLRRTLDKDSGGEGVEKSRTVSDKTASIWLKPKGKQRKDAVGEGGHFVSHDSHKEDQLLAKSRLALEAKAKAYEEMSKGRGLPDEDLNRHGDLCLVDFDRKLYEQTPPPSTDVKSSSMPLVAGGDEWVEYVDNLGRTRKCLQTDLNELTHLDRETGLGEGEELGEGQREVLTGGVEGGCPSEEHYQSLLQQEVRTHGVGYYQFSQDEEQRHEQLVMLGRLREQTVQQRTKSEGVKAKRRALMAARLKKVKQRKLGQTVGTSMEGEGEGEGEGEEGEGKEVDARVVEVIPPLAGEAAKRHIRPWDKGKVVGPVRQWRTEGAGQGERELEFAPPSSYFVKPKSTPQFVTSKDPAPSPTFQEGVGQPLLPPPPWTPSYSGPSTVDSLIANARAQQGRY